MAHRLPEKLTEEQAFLRRLVNEWNPIGVEGLPDDEYDCIVIPVLEQLHKGVGEGAITQYLETMIPDHFGIDPAEPVAPFASQVVAWYAAQRRPGKPEAESRGSAAFQTLEVVLYQPDEVLERRAGDVAELAAYVKDLQTECSAYFAGITAPEALDIVVAVRPPRSSRVWLVSPTRNENDPLCRRLEEIEPPQIREGPLAFAILASVAGGRHPSARSEGPFAPPMPREWQEATARLSGPVTVPDAILELVWPPRR